MTIVHVVLPGDVDDVTVPSGGNIYDRRACEGLPGVHETALPGAWPRPASTAGLAAALAASPDGEVVLLDGIVACGVPEVVVPQAKRLRLAVLVHLPLADETGLAPPDVTDLDARERETVQAVRAVIATSGWAANRLIEHHGLPPEKVHVVPPGTDPAPLAPGTDGVSHLLCVASLTPRKAQHLLVEALARVEGAWRCTLAGPVRRDAAYVERIRKLIRRHGLGERIDLAGPLTGRALENAYAAADLVVLPSLAETYGMVVTEALARGIPVLATDVAGIAETLGAAGIVVPPGDAAALADGLRSWFGDPVRRDALRGEARARRGMLAPWTETSRRLAAVLARL
ncbi:glycosyltransferase family 4 protein [Amycolatopsis alkalitolerans]|uniref:Glycosyltransferase family 4 protein n=1 Tax=Amycolatopsis alkalitolerans TaxID=2547244 RepID=A0A5C4M1E6_9PSEU|nr:glycosyltransferase family 4 protein [Amycolatopsis alkalitolerans]TNC23568.1 glycosyltransferase family 4 protein [Amycolatopsis alkalitolerans]